MAVLGGLTDFSLIHNFTIVETRRLEKFTVYKILMISFPRNSDLFSSLTKITVWKRYSDFKELETSLSKVYKSYNFKNSFRADKSFFKRYDPAVIEQRKKNILEFLYYCASNSVIYRSQFFVKFFENGSCSPLEDRKSIEDVRECVGDSLNSSLESESSLLNTAEMEESILSKGIPLKEEEDNSFDNISTDQFDYLYDAAMKFSKAVQEEANLRFKPAFELYKIGIDKLLTGAKSDNNERRKRIAKAKAAKYLERAEMLYENQIMHLQDEQLLLENPVEGNEHSVLALERPVNNLSRFKVIAINDYLMRVQDCTDKKFYVLKRAYKYQNCKVLLPQSIPYMIKLESFYKTETSLFLLLTLIPGGLLWDYINISKSETSSVNLEEIFVEPPTGETKEVASEVNCDLDQKSSVIESITHIEPTTLKEEVISSELLEAVNIPSFDTLSSDMDINELMSCSQKLLQSVSKTLEKSHAKEKLEKCFDIIVAAPLKQVEVRKADAENHGKLFEIPDTMLRQWFCELIVAINHLHKSGIICGDLNLNNIMLGPRGHLVLTYFYQVDCDEHQQLCRLNPNAMRCQYVAFDFPITQDSDWYSLGVIMYEIVTRERFYLYHPSGVSRFNEIQYSDPDSISDDVKSLLHGLIIEKSEKRLKFDDLIIHPFFTSIDWSEVEKCGLELFKIPF